ncbi:hypothetical protein SDC9_175094 [bioreactor metagenome]|uniref:Uncharacterized protein n=1 Tax=bioreactor metagenome TaxID=1076179 RepID=A0A645GNA8_9ZZZZ
MTEQTTPRHCLTKADHRTNPALRVHPDDEMTFPMAAKRKRQKRTASPPLDGDAALYPALQPMQGNQ